MCVCVMCVIYSHLYDHTMMITINTVLQFVLLMVSPSMRVEWRYITMVYGVQCVMMDGI